MNNYYVYIYWRLDTNEPFYIGKGKGYRWNQLCNRSEHFINIINKYPIVCEIIKDNLTEEQALGIECWIINELVFEYGFSIDIPNNRSNEKGYHLVNATWGGEGTSGHNPYDSKTKEEIEEWRRKNSEAHKGLQVGEKNGMYGKGYLVSGEKSYWYGKHHTEESKIKLRIANLGKHLTDETKQKISENNHWKCKKRPEHSERMKGKNNPMYEKNPWDYMSEETKKEKSKKMSERMSGKNSPRAKSVICLTTKRIFLTVKEGAKYYKIKGDANVSKCCKGELKSAGKLPNGTKLVWRYLVWNHNRKYYIKER